MDGRGSPPGLVSIRAFPPWESFSHTSSSFFLASFSRVAALPKKRGSKFTMKEMDGLNLDSGPALMSWNFCPHSSKETISASP